MSDQPDQHRRRDRDQGAPDEREPLRRKKAEYKGPPANIASQYGQTAESSQLSRGTAERRTTATVPEPKPPPLQTKPTLPPQPAKAPQVPKPPPPGARLLPVLPKSEMSASSMQPPPPNLRGTAGRAPANPKGKPPPPAPSLALDDVWNNSNVTQENRRVLTSCEPEWYCNHYGLGAEGGHILAWRTAVEEFMDRDDQQRASENQSGLPGLQKTSVEDYLKNLRQENRRTGESVARVAQILKSEMITESFLAEISENARTIVTQQYRCATKVRMSQGKLPAHEHVDHVLGQVNAAMASLDSNTSGGIVLVTGGTGTGKSSVLAGSIYLRTIEEASKKDRKRFGMNELRPGGRIMVTQPWKALAKTMASHLKNINKEHQYLFGFHCSGHASSSSHKEPILYMTEGITVAILMTWVSQVMTLVKKRRTWDGIGGTEGESERGGTAGLRAA
eukprot:5118801-Amphidinium_carterae.1